MEVNMDAKLKKELQKTACKVRMGVIEGTYNAKSGHPGGSLSISDTLTYLYFNKMNNDLLQKNQEQKNLVFLTFFSCLTKANKWDQICQHYKMHL